VDPRRSGQGNGDRRRRGGHRSAPGGHQGAAAGSGALHDPSPPSTTVTGGNLGALSKAPVDSRWRATSRYRRGVTVSINNKLRRSPSDSQRHHPVPGGVDCGISHPVSSGRALPSPSPFLPGATGEEREDQWNARRAGAESPSGVGGIGAFTHEHLHVCLLTWADLSHAPPQGTPIGIAFPEGGSTPRCAVCWLFSQRAVVTRVQRDASPTDETTFRRSRTSPWSTARSARPSTAAGLADGRVIACNVGVPHPHGGRRILQNTLRSDGRSLPRKSSAPMSEDGVPLATGSTPPGQTERALLPLRNVVKTPTFESTSLARQRFRRAVRPAAARKVGVSTRADGLPYKTRPREESLRTDFQQLGAPRGQDLERLDRATPLSSNPSWAPFLEGTLRRSPAEEIHRIEMERADAGGAQRQEIRSLADLVSTGQRHRRTVRHGIGMK